MPVPKPSKTAMLPAVSTAPPPPEMSAVSAWTDQFLECDRILDTRKKSLSHMGAPQQQEKATFTSALQIPGLCLRLLLVSEVVWPEMKLAYSFGELSNPSGHQDVCLCKCFLPASSKSRVAEPGHEGRGGTCLLVVPMERETTGV